jgi:nucleotide-binding universal stress UspA family protein
MKTILCPVDFSKTSVNASEYASFLAEDFNAEVILLFVYEAPTLYSDIPLTNIQTMEEDLVANAHDKLNKLKEKLNKKFKNIKFKSVILEGNVGQMVAQYSRQIEADVIVVGKTGNSKLKRLIMGSTTADIIQEASCPVLTIPNDNVFNKINKIIFATDLHENNIASSLAITDFAKHFNAEIVFVFVDDNHLIHSDEKILEMTRKIKKRVKYPKLSGFISKNTSIYKGLEYFLEKHKGDLLVMFSHQRHFPGTLFNQSITKLVSYQTKIPLLALKISDALILE